jgi:hypothetical protein
MLRTAVKVEREAARLCRRVVMVEEGPNQSNSNNNSCKYSIYAAAALLSQFSFRRVLSSYLTAPN